MNHLRQIQTKSRCISGVGGCGLMIGVESVNTQAKADKHGKYPGYSLLASRIQDECLRRGLIIEIGGRFDSVVRFLLPLIVTAEKMTASAKFSKHLLR